MGFFLDHKYGPTALFLSADFAFSIMDAMAQLLERKGFPTGQVVFLRMSLTAIACAIYIRVKQPDLFTGLFDLRDRTNRLIWIRGVNHTAGLCALYTGFRYLPLSDAMAVGRLRPFPIALLCFVVLGEPFTSVQGIAAVISTAAVLLVVKPEFLFGEDLAYTAAETAERVLGFTAICASVLFHSVDNDLNAGALTQALLVRIIGITDPAYMLLVYSLAASAIGPMWMLVESRPVVWSISPESWVLVLALATSGLLPQLAQVAAIQREHGAKMAVLGYFEVVPVVFAQYIFTGTVPNLSTLLGIDIIITVGVWCILETPAREGSNGGNEDGVALKESEYTRVPQDEA